MYLSIIKESFHLTKQSRGVWLLGFFASLLGNGGMFEIFFGSYQSINQSGSSVSGILLTLSTLGVFNGNFFTNAAQVAKNDTKTFLLVIGIAAAALLLFFVVLFLSFTGLIAVIQNALGKNTSAPGIRTKLAHAKKFFWRVFSLRLISYFFSLTLTAASGVFFISFFSADHPLMRFAVFFIFFVLLAAINIVFYFLSIYGSCGVITKNLTVIPAIRHGIAVFKKNWLESIEMGMFLFVINFGVFTLATIALAILTLPLIMVLIILVLTKVSALWISIALIAAIAVFTLGIMCVAALFAVFQNTVWAIMYRDFEKGTAVRHFFLRIFKIFSRA